MTIKDLDRLVELLLRHGMAKDQNLFVGAEEYNKWISFLKNLGSGTSVKLNVEGANPELICDRICYAGFNFNLIQY